MSPPRNERSGPRAAEPGNRHHADQAAVKRAKSVPVRLASPWPAEPYQLTDLPERIASRIVIHPTSGCWIVGGYHDKDGYARIRGRGAHRVIWEHFNGQVPPKLLLDHREDLGCLSKACGWPAHLLPVTNRENCTRNGVHGVAAVSAAKTRCDHGHELDLYNTYWRPDGHRDCRICIGSRVKKYRRRLREAARAADLAAVIELRPAA